MRKRSGPTVAGGLWMVAFASLLLAALVSRPVASNLLSLAAVGHALTALAIFLEPGPPSQASFRRGRAFTVGSLGVFLLGELLGTAIALGLGGRPLALWFTLGAGFAAVGIAATWRRVPGDDVFACQLAFHAIVLIPLFGAFQPYGLGSATRRLLGEEALEQYTPGFAVVIFSVMAIPLLLLSLSNVLAHNLEGAAGDRSLSWAVLLAHQVIFLLFLFRWTAGGF